MPGKRPPTSHVSTHSRTGRDPLTAAHLGSGTADATTFLRGDLAWAAPAGGGTMDHAALTSNLAWTSSGHTGGAHATPIFGAAGAASAVAAPTAGLRAGRTVVFTADATRANTHVQRWHSERRHCVMLNQGGTTVTGYGIGAAQRGSTAAGASNTEGLRVRYTSASAGGTAGPVSSTFTWTRRDWSPRMRVTVWTDADVSSLRIWIALVSAEVGNSTAGAAHHAGLRYDTGVGGNWMLSCKDGATQSTTDTGVAVATSTKYAVELWIDAATSTFYAAINGTVYSHATNLPASGTDLGLLVNLSPITAVSRSLYTSSVEADTDP